MRRRAEQLYEQLDFLMGIRQAARTGVAGGKPEASRPASFSNRFPLLGPIRVALLIALLQTPHRFRTKRQLWAYCGLALADADQRRISVHRRTTATFQKAGGAARSQPQP